VFLVLCQKIITAKTKELAPKIVIFSIPCGVLIPDKKSLPFAIATNVNIKMNTNGLITPKVIAALIREKLEAQSSQNTHAIVEKKPIIVNPIKVSIQNADGQFSKGTLLINSVTGINKKKSAANIASDGNNTSFNGMYFPPIYDFITKPEKHLTP